MSQAHEELLRRIEQATGSDRQLDIDLYATFVEQPTSEKNETRPADLPEDFGDDDFGRQFHPAPRYTASIDAALGLVERLLGKHWLWQVKSGIEFQCILWMLETDYDDRQVPTGYSATSAPLAILTALLRALPNDRSGS